MRNPLVWRELRAVVADWVRAGLVGTDQSKLARKSGVRRETIYRILQQQTDASPKTLGRLAAVLGAFPVLHRTPQGGGMAPRMPQAPRSRLSPRGGGGSSAEQSAPHVSQRHQNVTIMEPQESSGDTLKVESVRQQAALASEAIGRIVEGHEVVGEDLRSLLNRMAIGLDKMGHRDASMEIMETIIKLMKLEAGNG